MSPGRAGHDHSMQHLTDVQTRRIVTRAGDGYAAISWDYPGSTLLEVRIFRSLERDDLLAYYRTAEIALITPLKDGMNLVAKEY